MLKLMLKEYPDVMDIAQMCQILDVSTKNGVSTGYEKAKSAA